MRVRTQPAPYTPMSQSIQHSRTVSVCPRGSETDRRTQCRSNSNEKAQLSSPRSRWGRLLPPAPKKKPITFRCRPVNQINLPLKERGALQGAISSPLSSPKAKHKPEGDGRRHVGSTIRSGHSWRYLGLFSFSSCFTLKFFPNF